MRRKADYEDFWDDVHRNNRGFWIAGTRPESYLADLKIDMDSFDSVMEIGVGYGHMVRHLIDAGKDVTAVDISIIPLVALPDRCRKKLIEDFAGMKDNSIDLAISYLTFQHVDDEMAMFIYRNSVRIAREFRYQIASLIDPDAGVTGFDPGELSRGPLFFRQPLPGSEVIGTRDHGSHNIRWYFCRATQPDIP